MYMHVNWRKYFLFRTYHRLAEACTSCQMTRLTTNKEHEAIHSGAYFQTHSPQIYNGIRPFLHGVILHSQDKFLVVANHSSWVALRVDKRKEDKECSYCTTSERWKYSRHTELSSAAVTSPTHGHITLVCKQIQAFVIQNTSKGSLTATWVGALEDKITITCLCASGL